MVSKKVFNYDGSDSQIRVATAFKNYGKLFPLPYALTTTIQGLEKTYNTQNMQGSFDPFTLKAASQKAIENYHYIYTMPLVDTTGQPIQDDKKNALLDYLVFIVVDGTILDNNFQPGLISH